VRRLPSINYGVISIVSSAAGVICAPNRPKHLNASWVYLCWKNQWSKYRSLSVLIISIEPGSLLVVLKMSVRSLSLRRNRCTNTYFPTCNPNRNQTNILSQNSTTTHIYTWTQWARWNPICLSYTRPSLWPPYPICLYYTQPSLCPRYPGEQTRKCLCHFSFSFFQFSLKA